jgi:putative transposase
MPDHVHLIFEPVLGLSEIMRWLKGRTARNGNRILGQTGSPFWQGESFDHWIRNEAEFRDLCDYVETNPVKAGLVACPEDWAWSSAGDRFVSPAS